MYAPKVEWGRKNQREGGVKMTKRSFFQDAKTGKIVSKEYAKNHPDRTIKHTFNTKKGKQSAELRARQTIFLNPLSAIVVIRTITL